MDSDKREKVMSVETNQTTKSSKSKGFKILIILGSVLLAIGAFFLVSFLTGAINTTGIIIGGSIVVIGFILFVIAFKTSLNKIMLIVVGLVVCVTSICMTVFVKTGVDNIRYEIQQQTQQQTQDMSTRSIKYKEIKTMKFESSNTTEMIILTTTSSVTYKISINSNSDYVEVYKENSYGMYNMVYVVPLSSVYYIEF